MLTMPDDLTMLAFFESEPVEQKLSDGFACYKYADDQVELYFSYNIFECSIQTRILVSGKQVSLHCQEGCENVSVVKGHSVEYLKCNFQVASGYRQRKSG
ncbi:hypothetical protein B6A42_17105 [Vibrio coralliilyticus]|nr:hypothetical protein B6A42_17105 [Vibrio coralliilyticus]